MHTIKYFSLFLIIGLLFFVGCSQSKEMSSRQMKDKSATTEAKKTNKVEAEVATDGYYDDADMGGEILMEEVAVEEVADTKTYSTTITESAEDGAFKRASAPSGPAGPTGATGAASSSGAVGDAAASAPETFYDYTPSGPPADGRETKALGYSYSTIKGTKKRTKKDRLPKSIKAEYDYEVEPPVAPAPEKRKALESLDLKKLTEKAGTLTAGEIHDFSKWELWQDISDDALMEYKNTWKISPKNRYTIQLSTSTGHPVVDAEIFLLAGEEIVWESRSDNTGKAELWNNLFDQRSDKKLSIQALYEGELQTMNKVIPFHKGINHLSFDTDCNYPLSIDIAFVVDATGSMGDEIRYLQTELYDIINRTKKAKKDMDLRLGTVFYRDKGEAYITRNSPLSNDFDQTIRFIREQVASGGGDYPEAVEEALKVSIETLEWKEEATARLLFMVLDAPPHKDAATIKKMQDLSQLAAKKGIRIIPVTGSGINKSVEYLMRSLALATNGTYTFLTDDSGVGGKHIKPTTDKYDVEKLNDLIVRLIQQYTELPDCDDPGQYVADKGNEPNNDQIVGIKCYPNPSDGLVNVDLESDVEVLFVTDGNGKILLRYENLKEGTHEIDLRQYPTGTYFFRFNEGDRIGGERVMIVH